LLVRMIHTKDGAKVAVTCLKQSTAKVTYINFRLKPCAE
jgi:hypothetical protein